MKVDKFRTVIIYIIIILLGLVCLLPLLNIVAISFSSSAAVEGNMVGLIPVGFSTAAYEKILEDSQFWHSFLISVERVVLTLIINFVLIVLMAYPLSKTNAQFRGRNIYANLMIFAMLFNGGMIPTFLLVKSYGLLNTVWALVLPGAVPIFNVILVMNFFAAVPKELEEAAFIDGAKEGFQTAITIIPYLVAILVGVGVFRASGAMDFLIDGVRMGVATIGLNTDFVEALPTILMKPLSGSGARGMMLDAMNTYGADSFVGRLSAIVQGSCDTTFYVVALYYGSVGIRDTRYTVPCALLADLAGAIAAIAMAYVFFS